MDSAKIYRLETERGRTVIHYEGRLISFARDLRLNVYGDIYEFTLYYNQRVLEEFSLKVQQFASKHKPQTFSRVCLRLKRDVYRWKRNVSLLM
jgi:hypothetical protein